MSKKQYEKLISYIPYGKKNAISQTRLSDLMGCEKTELRAYIQNARIDGIPICSIPGVTGYYFSDEEPEVLECYRVFKHRHLSTGEVLKTIGRHLKSVQGGETDV